MDEINPALRQRLEERKLVQQQLYGPPSGRYRSRLASAHTDKLPLFWIAYFAIFVGLSWYFGQGL